MFKSKKNQQAINTVSQGADGVINLSYKGPQTRESLRVLTDDLLHLMARQRQSGGKVNIFADMRGITKADSSARLESKWFLEETDFDALAVVGNRYLQPVVFFVLRDFKDPHKAVRYFTHEKAARDWLQNPTPDTNLNKLKPRNRLKWALIPLIFLTLVSTWLSWQQANSRIESEANKQFGDEVTKNTTAINTRLNSFIDILYGLRGLYHSSETVTEREFSDYLESLKLDTKHPGFEAVNFIGTSHDSSSGLNRFVVMYTSTDGVGPVKGTDLTSHESLRKAMAEAIESGEPTATVTIKLLDTNGREQTSTKGFVLFMPIYKDSVPETLAKRQANSEGFVSITFDYQKLFKQTFFSTASHGVAVTVIDKSDSSTLYQSDTSIGELRQSTDISLPNANWRLQVSAARLFGVSSTEARLPAYVATSGIFTAILLTIIVFVQNRGRQRAIDLASSMTEDIKQERNTAISVKNKDEAILSSIGDGVVVIDINGQVTLFNKAAELMSGFLASEVVGQTYKLSLYFYNEKDGSAADGFITKALSGNRSQMPPGTMLRKKSGAAIPVADSAAPVKNAAGEVIGAVIVFRDTTREKELEHLKDDFVSIASHELRTPMGAVRAFSSMILAGDYGPVNPNLIEPLTDIRNSTLRLVNLVNDMLDVARIEAGRMKFELTDFDLAAAIKEVVSSLTPLAKEKSIALSANPSGPCLVQADINKAKQVLTNMIGNALKFTDEGSINVQLQVQNDLATITVTDTGQGIDPADQGKLFGKFQQISSIQEGRPPGTGLGLYISREIARKMGGELWIISSTPGQGSAFGFSLVLSNTARARAILGRITSEATLYPDQK